MKPLLKKELKLLFSHSTALISWGLFLLITGGVLWFLNGFWNIFSVGFADASPFFELAPWLLCILIPAMGMYVFTEEYRTGTWVILRTKSVSIFQIFASKVLSQILFVLVGLIFTGVYIYSIHCLSAAPIDKGIVLLSYIGLLLISLCFICITALIATIFRAPVIVMLMSVLVCMFVFYGFQYIGASTIVTNYPLEILGFYEHYQTLQKGILSSEDIFYFCGIMVFLSGITLFKMGAFPFDRKKITFRFLMIFIGGYLLISLLPQRIDCTRTGKYTLAPSIKIWLEKINRPLLVSVYL